MPSGRVELWSACSIDGAWHFERLEIEGTPWEVTCTIAPGWSMLATTLAKARRYAHGQLQLHLDLAGLTSRALVETLDKPTDHETGCAWGLVLS